MTSRRVLKAAEAIREVVSMAILVDLKDPRVRDVTVTSVEVSPDMRQAKINVSVMGDETRQNLTLRGLQNAAGFLQSKVAKRIDTRYTPRLTFMLDLGIKRSIEISQILSRVLPPAQDEPLRNRDRHDAHPVEEANFDQHRADERRADERRVDPASLDHDSEDEFTDLPAGAGEEE